MSEPKLTERFHLWLDESETIPWCGEDDFGDGDFHGSHDIKVVTCLDCCEAVHAFARRCDQRADELRWKIGEELARLEARRIEPVRGGEGQ